MTASWTLILRDGEPLAAVRRDGSGKVLVESQRVWTLTELSRRAGRSRRQLYRDIQAGRLRPLGKFLGEWLIDAAELARRRPPPAGLWSLFPEYDRDSLDLERDRETVLSRILRSGGRDVLRWTFRFYGEASVRSYVKDRGPRSLDGRSLAFWLLFFDLPQARPDPARAGGRRWGGAQ